MTSSAKYIPEGFHTATPYLMVKDAARAIEFYTQAFGATTLERLTNPNGEVMHAEIKIGDSPIMMGQHEGLDTHDPKLLPPVSIYLYVEDADAIAAQAVAAGAKELSPVKQQFYGNREGGVEDPFGIIWWIATRVEEMATEEIQQRAGARQE